LRVELRIHAAAVSQIGQPLAILQSGDQLLLLHAALARSLVRDQCVRNLGKRGLNGLLVLNQRAIALGFREFDVRLEAAGGERSAG
jgi:hypothetical protein